MVFAHRMQIQETLTAQIAAALDDVLKPSSGTSKVMMKEP
jgi:GTP cyclohydrolase I